MAFESSVLVRGKGNFELSFMAERASESESSYRCNEPLMLLSPRFATAVCLLSLSMPLQRQSSDRECKLGESESR